jgi:predicted phosphodiesterase
MNLTQEICDIIGDLLSAGKNWQNITSSLKSKGFVGPKVKPNDVSLAWSNWKGSDKTTAHQRAQEDLDKYIGAASLGQKVKRQTAKNGVDKILTISDLHIPFHDKKRIAEIFEAEKDCNILVIAGDLMNGDAMSDHLKVIHNDFREELAQTAAFLEHASKRFEKVYVLDGNHDQDRYVRLLAKSARADIASWFYDSLNPLTQVKAKLPNVFRAAETHKNKLADKIGHTLVLGDCLWSHLTVSGKDGASVRAVRSWYDKWREYFGWNCRVFQQGHTHQLSINYDYDSAIIQTGCLVNMDGLEYSLASHGRSSPPCYGYTVIEQRNGVTDLGSIKVRKL